MSSKQNNECNNLDINGMEDSGSCQREGHTGLYIYHPEAHIISMLLICHSKANLVLQLPVVIGGVLFEIDIQQDGPFYMKPRSLTLDPLASLSAMPLSNIEELKIAFE